MSTAKRLVRRALADLMPSGGAMPGILETDWDGFVERYSREAPVHVWAGVVAGAVVYELTPILTVRRPRRASRLSAELRDRHANEVTGHDLYLVRQAVFLLKLSAGFAWGAHPSVRSKLGLEPYDPDPGTWRDA